MIQLNGDTLGEGRPKVLIVCHNHPHLRPGGAEGYAFNLYEALLSAGEFEPVFLGRTGAASPVSHVAPAHRYTPVSAVNRDPNQYLLYTDLTELD